MTRKEAIKIIKSATVYTSEEMDALETLIPELAESDDERIRHEIINFIYQEIDKKILTKEQREKSKSWLAYLKKQKAKERLDRMAPIYNDKDSFESALEKAWKYYNESASRTVDSFEDDYIECVFSKGFREGFLYREKQKEQKPVEYLDKDMVYAIMKKLHDLSFSQGIIINSEEYKKIDEITHDVRSLLDYPIEQKPWEWSEEETKILDSIIDDYEKAAKSFCGYDGKIGLLRAIRDGEYDLPKQEWSEEDKDYYDTIVRKLEVIGDDSGLSNNQIKFLREHCPSPRPSWKPSEEQMEALSDACVEASTFKKGDILESLYNDLKKL